MGPERPRARESRENAFICGPFKTQIFTMADSKDTKQKKRKVEDEGEEVAAAKTKRAKAEKPVKIKAAPKFKPYSPAEEVIAAGASMQRNAAIADFVKGIMEVSSPRAA